MGLSIVFGLVIVLALHGSKLQFDRSTQAVIELAAWGGFCSGRCSR
jgi:hypothetical protein